MSEASRADRIYPPGHGLGDHGLYIIRLHQIASHGHDASASRLDLLGDTFRAISIAGIGDRHMRAGFAKCFGDTGADRSSGDESDLACKPSTRRLYSFERSAR
ncbi:hypothetical protein [Bradyrhizobium sp. dw_78]|uniref:hypothetical protein n=1 Tax=Bradyrhizobium sp. dw_78 TaxID=2719793 RepID=UPI00201C9932|nr:hypothetical protein [Bradyrhizobium sp. dw_78]